MHTELTHTYPVSLSRGFGYIDDFHTWPRWYVGMCEIVEPDEASWTEPDDQVRFAYTLLGRRVEGVAVLEERVESKLARFRTEVPGLPVVHFAYHYTGIARDMFELAVEMDTDETGRFYGTDVDRTLVPKAIERDMGRSLENLEDIFGAGLMG